MCGAGFQELPGLFVRQIKPLFGKQFCIIDAFKRCLGLLRESSSVGRPHFSIHTKNTVQKENFPSHYGPPAKLAVFTETLLGGRLSLLLREHD